MLKRLLLLAAAFGACSAWRAPAARAGPGDAASDSVYLVGEFVDPVCIYQHGMQGTLQRKCATVTGRVEQGMFFLDIRRRRLYTVIGQTHWQDPRQGFLQALGDTFAIRARVWRRMGSAALAVTAVYPYRDQPRPSYRAWPTSSSRLGSTNSPFLSTGRRRYTIGSAGGRAHLSA